LNMTNFQAKDAGGTTRDFKAGGSGTGGDPFIPEHNANVVSALPAGNNNIGDVDVLTLPALPAGNNNIGDVDVVSLPALPTGSNTIGKTDQGTGGASAWLTKSEVQADFDTSGGTQNISLQGIALPASGGAVVGGTSTNPVRTDPTGATTQPVSGTVTANIGTSGNLALDATLTGGTQKSIVRGGAKGSTSAADVTSTASGSNHQPLDVVIYDTSGNAITSFGGSGGTAQGDKTGFTEGTTNFTPVGGVYNETISGDPTEDQAAAARITAKRAVHTNLRNASGTEIGTSSNPIRTDPTGTTTQPVSGTVTANAGTGNFSANTAQVGGNTVNTGTGNAGTGTQRIVIASDQPVIPISDNSGSLTVDNGGTFGVQDSQVVADNAAFTDGTTKVFMGGYVFDETAGTSLTENDAAASRIDSKRAQVLVLEDETTRGRRLTITSSNAAKVDGSGVTQPVSGTVTASNTAGDVAHDSADSGNPVKVGGVARSSEITAVANGDRANLVTDLVGKLITLPYCNPENLLAGSTSDITGTSNTSIIAPQGASVRIYVTSLIVTNSHATVGTWVNVKDGTTTIYTGYAAAVGGGFAVTLPTPLRLTANTALNAACETTGSNTRVSAVGYKGA
jgi:hypothetical protein